MKEYRISYYDEFQCLGEACPDCCCIGWRIPLTDEDVRRYRAENGWLGFRLSLSMRGDEALRVFSDRCIRCPFMTRRGLCGLQIKKGHDYIPETCRTYPRSVIRHMDRVEYHLDLSCEHAAELFLRRGGTLVAGAPQRKAPCDGEENKSSEEGGSTERALNEECRERPQSAPEAYGDNEDAEYLEALLQSREELLSALAGVRTAEELDLLLRRIGAFTKSVQEKTLSTGVSGLKAGAFTDRLKTPATSREEAMPGRLFPLPVGTLNRLMGTDLYDRSLRRRAPHLYRLCRLYFRRFDRLNAGQGQQLLEHMFEEQVVRDPAEVRLYSDYISSLILRRYTESFEDYSLYLHFEDILTGANLLLLFRLLCRDKDGELTEREAARIIASLEKRIFHNEKIKKQLRLSLTESLQAE